MKQRLFLFCLLLLLVIQLVEAQTVGNFTQVGVGLPTYYQTYNGHDWGDYDNDGDFDLITTGSAGSRLRRNDNGTFAEVTVAGLPNITYGAAAWGDFDNDNDLDLLLSGWGSGSSYITEIWKNNGGGSFAKLAGTTMPGFTYGDVEWGDYDVDGDLDFFVAGDLNNDPANKQFQIWTNNGNQTFTQFANPLLTGGRSGAWGDYDNDGDLDLLLAEATLGPELWRYDSGTYVKTGVAIPGGHRPSWGDFDADGDIDVLMPAGGSTKVWRNDGSETFTEFATLPGVNGGSAVWGDHDNDGDLDVLLTGFGGTKLWNYNGTTYESYASFSNSEDGENIVLWGDYDKDLDLDFLFTGRSFSGGVPGPATRFWRNTATINKVPIQPNGLTVTTYPNGNVTLSWLPTTDDHTPSGGLTYNIRIGTSSGGSNVVNPMAANIGVRRVLRRGNVGNRTSFTINLPPGKYSWAVQAIDGAFVGSQFATGDDFDAVTNNAPVFTDQTRYIAENNLPNASVGLPVIATDIDAGQAISYTIVSGNENGIFAIHPISGQIVATAPLDHETQSSYVLGVKATDNGTVPASTTVSVTVEVLNGNEAPTLTGVNPAYTINEGDTVIFDANATDPDTGQTLTFSLENVPDDVTIHPSTGQFNWTPDTSGVYNFIVRVSDGSLSDSQNVQIAVNEIIDPNDPPVLTGVEPVYVLVQGDTLVFNAEVTDPDTGQTLTFSLDNPPLGASIDSATGDFTWTPDTAGNFTFTVRVSDGFASDHQDVFVKVAGIQELLVNGGFETALTSADWKPLTLTKDKRVCNTTTIYTSFGTCAFMFRASATENSRLTQKVKLPLIANLNINDTLTLSAQVKAINIKSLKVIRATVRYIDGTTAPLSLNIPAAPTGYYELLTSPPLTLTKPVQSIQVMIQFRGKTGRIYVDDVSLLHVPDAVLRRAALPR